MLTGRSRVDLCYTRRRNSTGALSTSILLCGRGPPTLTAGEDLPNATSLTAVNRIAETETTWRDDRARIADVVIISIILTVTTDLGVPVTVPAER